MGLLAGSGLVQGFISRISQMPGMLWGYLASALGSIGSFAGSAMAAAASAGSGIYNGIARGIAGIPGLVYSELMRIATTIMSAGSSLYGRAVSLGQQIVNGLKAGLGISSPGFMYWAMFNEVGLMERILRNNNLSTLSQLLGADITNSFLPSLSDLDLNAITSTQTTDQTSQPVNFNVEIKRVAVTIEGNADSETIEDAGESLGEGIIKGALSNGVNLNIG